jgi:hypothetical protein
LREQKGSVEDYSVFNFGVYEKRVNMFVLRVDHINPVAKKAIVTVCEVEANTITPITVERSPK